MTSGATPLGLGVLASGRGSNLQAILDACARPGFPARVVVVISDRERAQALERARAAGVEARFINPKDFADREAFDLALVREFTARQVGLVCSAGFMRILSPVFVRALQGASWVSTPRYCPRSRDSMLSARRSRTASGSPAPPCTSSTTAWTPGR